MGQAFSFSEQGVQAALVLIEADGFGERCCGGPHVSLLEVKVAELLVEVRVVRADGGGVVEQDPGFIELATVKEHDSEVEVRLLGAGNILVAGSASCQPMAWR
jgi:hypothetical protein